MIGLAPCDLVTGTEGSRLMTESANVSVLEDGEVEIVGLLVGKPEDSVVKIGWRVISVEAGGEDVSDVLGASEVIKELEMTSICAYRVSKMPGGASRRRKRDSGLESVKTTPPQNRPGSPGHGRSQRPLVTVSAESKVSAA
jgi:hypothetical protein